MKRLEEVLDVPRDQWPPSALRAFWEPLLELADKRLKSPRHESRWFNLAGFFLRPGRGFPLDEIRIKALWPIFHQGVKHTKDVQCWAEWWILWRRVAAGLSRPHHEEIHRRLAPFLLPAKGTSPAKKAGRPKPEPHELAEMWRCAASLERTGARGQGSPGRCSAQGAHARHPAAPTSSGAWAAWVRACRSTARPTRSFARRPPSAGPRRCSNRSFAAGRETGDAIFALAQLAGSPTTAPATSTTRCGKQCIAGLTELGADENDLRPVREYHELESAQQVQALGDSLPIGLRLLSDASTGGQPA